MAVEMVLKVYDAKVSTWIVRKTPSELFHGYEIVFKRFCIFGFFK